MFDFLSTTGLTLVESFISRIKAIGTGASNNAKSATGNPVSKTLHTVRGATDTIPKQNGAFAANIMENILTNKKC